MTNAEALKFAEEMKSKLSYRLECSQNIPARSYYEKQDEMLTRAIAALREKEVRVLANGVTVQQWIPVTERLPAMDGEYLCYFEDGGCCAVYFDETEQAFGEWINEFSPATLGWCGEHFEDYQGITHWMPLHKPPECEIKDFMESCEECGFCKMDGGG